MIGSGYDSELGTLLKTVASSNIYFLGIRKNISDYMSNSDIFALSSVSEGMPIIIIGVLLSRVLMILTPVCGTVDVVNGKNGILCKNFTTESYTAVLSKVTGNLAYYK